jgi:formylglycine-generating enzyme required for sulfatase activity
VTATLALFIGVLAAACRSDDGEPARDTLPSDTPLARSATKAAASAARSAVPEPKPLPPCPDGMARLGGGKFWVGSEPGRYSEDESPRYRTELADFCLDATEVTVRAYTACAEAGTCTAARSGRRYCNYGKSSRADHPVNCVDWHQASTYCGARDARLPTEAEWEYAARGGARHLKYPWGEEPPDGRVCWKNPDGTCPVKAFAPDAFGLYDLSGNVWEWTDTGYGPYPWPPERASAKVYRGGSWSRRFAKWMHTRLRNRYAPDQQGAHLGFRCAKLARGAKCPFGADEAGACHHGVLDVQCAGSERFNGVRCARDGEARCPPGHVERAGRGCVVEARPAANRGAGPAPVDTSSVSAARSPEFDSDCRRHYPTRPNAYRYAGGSHAARNQVSRGAGCKNRDVGVGFNSTCCP